MTRTRRRRAAGGTRAAFVREDVTVRKSRPFALAVAAMVMAFFLVVAFRPQGTPNAANRLPARYRLADLIQREQAATNELRTEVAGLRAEVAEQRARQAEQSSAVGSRQSRLSGLSEVTGLSEMRGPGLRVTLDDSSLRTPTEGATVNDLVIHSQDVQAVVNALWRADAEAIAINGQRLVATSAVLCVGNTLLLNGTVHSPPFVVSAIGASRDRFETDRLVRRLRQASDAFDLRFEVARVNDLSVPGYTGSTKLTYAQPLPSTPS